MREVRDVGALATLDSFAPTARKRKTRRNNFWMMVIQLYWLTPYQGIAWNEGHYRGSRGSSWGIVATRGGTKPQEHARGRNPQKRRNSDTPLGCSG
jgi:hypothetical protein